MGWLVCPIHLDYRPGLSYVQDWLLKELFPARRENKESDQLVEMEVKAHTIKFGVLTVSSRIKVSELSTGKVLKDDTLATVILWEVRSSHRQYSICYKDMDETVGPYEAKPSLKLLKSLGPCLNTRSQNWRRNCLNNFKRVNDDVRAHILREADDFRGM